MIMIIFLNEIFGLQKTEKIYLKFMFILEEIVFLMPRTEIMYLMLQLVIK